MRHKRLQCTSESLLCSFSAPNKSSSAIFQSLLLYLATVESWVFFAIIQGSTGTKSEHTKMKMNIFFFCFLFGISTSPWEKAAADGTVDQLKLNQFNQSRVMEKHMDNIQCVDDFQPVGDHCLLVDNIFSRSWQEMRDLCLDLGGDLPNLSDANYLADINDYLIANGLNDVNYWVGSTDESSEGEWYWIQDQSLVKMGTPLWGDLADRLQQPTGGILENCGVLLQGDHYFMHDAACSDSYSLLCEQFDHQLTEGQDAMNRATSITNNTASIHVYAECPFPYTMIYGRCVFVNTLAESTWNGHTIFCTNLGGHMVKLDDANFLGALYDYLRQLGIEGHFWISASDDQQEGDWKWHDGTPVRLGTPFWGDEGDGPQEPDGADSQNCAVIYSGDHFFFHDWLCDSNDYVICEIDVS